MKRAATHLFKRQSETALFFKIIKLLFDLILPGSDLRQDRGAKTRLQGQLECANPLGSP